MNGPQLKTGVLFAIATLLALGNGTTMAASGGIVSFAGRVVESACVIEADNGAPVRIGQTTNIAVSDCQFRSGSASRATIAVTASETVTELVAIDSSVVEVNRSDQTPRLTTSQTRPLSGRSASEYVMNLGTRLVNRAAHSALVQLAHAKLNLEVTYK